MQDCSYNNNTSDQHFQNVHTDGQKDFVYWMLILIDLHNVARNQG